MSYYFSYCPSCDFNLDATQNKKGYCNNCGEYLDDHYFEHDDHYEDEMERKFEELANRAATCTCGAWQFTKDGTVVHVADCCCGAE